MCLDISVDPDVDVVFMEYVLNDGLEDRIRDNGKVAVAEKLVRRILALPRQPAVVMMQVRPAPAAGFSVRCWARLACDDSGRVERHNVRLWFSVHAPCNVPRYIKPPATRSTSLTFNRPPTKALRSSKTVCRVASQVPSHGMAFENRTAGTGWVPFHASPEDLYGALAQYYDLDVLSFRTAMYRPAGAHNCTRARF